MGCTASQATSHTSPNSLPKSYHKIINDNCPHIRLDHPKNKTTLPIQGTIYNYSLSYVYVSQRGYYPNALGKANQDSYLICENFLSPSSHFFGVFDGHGEFGDYCSHFAADHVPQYLEKEIQANNGLNVWESPNMEATYTAAFVNANKAMHKANFDDSLSGTTAITIFVKGDTLYVGNVGDSRAIIARETEEGKLRSHPLSVDQTPFRKDERERLKKKGARIMTLDQIEGNEEIHENWGTELGEEIDEVGDPPRVWDHTLERPGCAFTRSIGDNVAEQCGVYAEPEILVWKLNPKDKFAVIASDGVFEFLTSQSVVDAIAKFPNPLDAAKHVVSEAYRLWLTYDDRTDDITIIILCFDGFVERQDIPTLIKDEQRKKSHPNLEAQFKDIESKPIRSGMSKAKRKIISEAWSDEKGGEDFDFEAHATEKTPEQMKRISEMVKANFMFQSLSSHQKDQIFRVMTYKTVTAGETIIREGDKGDEMYIIDSGEFEVLKRDDNGINQSVFTYTTDGAAFGELSLMYGKPRAATVRAKTDGALWSIGRLAFRAVLMKKRTSNLLKALRGLPVLKGLSITKLHRIAERCTEETFNPNELVVSSSSMSASSDQWILLVVLEGSLRVVMKDGNAKTRIRGEGSTVGAIELVDIIESVSCDNTKTKIARIPESIFLEIMGDVKHDEILKMTKASRAARQSSIFSTPDMLKLSQGRALSDYELINYIITLGDYAYIGNYKSKVVDTVCSIKVIAKQRASMSKMDTGLLNERIYLAALQGTSEFLPRVIATYQNTKIASLIYDDIYDCDLAHILSINNLSNAEKCLYSACLYKALQTLHDNGLIHRFLNPSAIYISRTKKLPILADLRYAKKMDGYKSFTICGDPLYFAPEMVGQTGYDYSADLWALGVTIYELFEGQTPFGQADTEETKIFKAITSFKSNTLSFTANTPPPARQFISALLQPEGNLRLGYSDSEQVLQNPYFSGINWSSIQSNRSTPWSEEVVVDPSTIFTENELEPFQSSIFQSY